jgi:choloylglycine hydrolase
MRANLLKQSISFACALLFAVQASAASACTGVTLKAGDGSVVFGRTLEWGSFDLMSRLEVVPRGIAYKTHMPDGKAGLSWTGKYGVVGIDGVGKDLIIEGINEKGLDVGLFYIRTLPSTRPMTLKRPRSLSVRRISDNTS